MIVRREWVLAGGAGSGPRFRRSLLLVACVVPFTSACTGRGGPEPAGLPAGEPPIVEGPISAQDEAGAALALASAREAYRSGDYEGAREAARRVVERYSRAPASSLALRILAEASFRLRAYGDADAAAARYATLFDPSDPRAVALTLLSGRSRLATGDSIQALDILTRIPGAAPPPEKDSALAIIREIVRSLDTSTLERVASTLRTRGPLVAPVLTEHAIALHFSGDLSAAADEARQVLQLTPSAEERGLADAVLAGRLEDALGGAPLIGTLVPSSGAAYLSQSASEVEEGVQLAMSAYRTGARRPIQLDVQDDAASPQADATFVDRLERSRALAIIGPLLAPGVDAAARARQSPLPIVSPTARSLPEGLEGVYSLMAPDPSAARAVAQYARQAGIGTVAVMYPRTVQPRFEAAVFMDAFRAAGGTVVMDLAYDSTTTTFQALFTRVATARPHGLFLPLEERDIPVVAPQVAYYGLDTLGIQVLGTAAWAQQALLRRVGARSTDGVIAAAPLAADSSNAAYHEFVRAYERTYRKTMRSPLAAYGYDAAGLVLNAVRRGATTPSAMRRAFEAIRDFPGATGTISVQDGRIVRRHEIVRIESGRAVPVRAARR